MLTEQDRSFFDTMGGEFEARLKRNTITSRTSKSDGRELTVSNPLAILEAKFSYRVLDRLYSPSFVAIERTVGEERKYILHEVVGVAPTHYQLAGIDSSMPTLLRKEYLDTIKDSWGKSQETWIDLMAIPTNYMATIGGGDIEFTRARFAPLPGAQAWLLSKPAVEKFLCVAHGEAIGTMQGFDLPFTVDMDNLIRYHAGFFAYSLDYAEPLLYREGGKVKVGKIGELVDRHFDGGGEGRRYTSSIEVVSFDSETLDIRWSPLQYVFRHRYDGEMLRFTLRTGRSVTVSPGHSLFVLRGGKVQCLQSDSLQVGDYIVGSRFVPSASSELQKVNLLEACDLVGVNGLRLTGVDPESLYTLDLQVPNWKRWRWRRTGCLPVSYYGRLGEEARREVRLGYKNCLRPQDIFLTVDEDIARLFGYYTAEGHTQFEANEAHGVLFTLGRTKDGKIRDDIMKIVRGKFGIRVTVSRHGKAGIRVAFRSKILACLFSSAVGTGAGNKRVPSFILNSPSSVRSAFLRAWADCDCGVTTSQALMNDLLHMLMMDGVAGTVHELVGDGTGTTEVRAMKMNPRYTLEFPRGPDLREGLERTRRRAEPTPPVGAPSPALKSFLPHRSHVSTGEQSSKRGSGLVATQLLAGATQDLGYARRLLDSNLTFYEIESIGRVEPTSEFIYDVSVPHDENFLAGFGGVFCHNTGSGKSNLASALLRSALARDPSLTAVVIDIAGEYVVNLLDQLGKDARVISTESFDNEEEFVSSQAIPESLEEVAGRERIERALGSVWRRGVDRLSLQEGGGIDLMWIQQLMQNTVDSGKAGATAAKVAVSKFTFEFYEKAGHRPSTKLTELDEASRRTLGVMLTDLSQKVHEKSGLKSDVDLILEMLESGDFGAGLTARLSPEKLAEQLAKGQAPRLNILYLPEPLQARMATERLVRRLLFHKKKHGNKQRVLILLDEAQEYIPDEHTDREYTTQSNRAVEQLLRQGRKYRLHCWMATQRVARLNVNALQQLHSYFVSTLPRMYDRMVIADAFALPYEVLEKSAELGTGEWLFVSFKAAKQRNVPVFLKTENNEAAVAKSFA